MILTTKKKLQALELNIVNRARIERGRVIKELRRAHKSELKQEYEIIKNLEGELDKNQLFIKSEQKLKCKLKQKDSQIEELEEELEAIKGVTTSLLETIKRLRDVNIAASFKIGEIEEIEGRECEAQQKARDAEIKVDEYKKAAEYNLKNLEKMREKVKDSPKKIK